MRAQTLTSVTRWLLIGLDLLMVGLVVVAVLRGGSNQPWTALAGVALLGLYGWGRAGIRIHERPIDSPRGGWWPAGAWITGLVLVWAVLLLVSSSGLWIAFPLMFLQMHVLGPRLGVAAVAITTVLAAADGLWKQSGSEMTIGPILGPVVGAAVAVAVTIGFEALISESQLRQRTSQELALVRAHVAEVEQQAAVAGERERLARDIHDTLAQGYSAIELLLRVADRAIGVDDVRARSYLDQARRTATDNLGEARRFVRELAPVDLDGVDLAAALRRVAERSAATTSGTLAITVEVSGEARALPLQLETALVRLTQSALANVVQHAQAHRAVVTLTYDDHHVVLDIVDDGEGFDVHQLPQTPGGFGLVAMRSRVTELGGSLTLDTAPGDGTAVAVRVPTSSVAVR